MYVCSLKLKVKRLCDANADAATYAVLLFSRKYVPSVLDIDDSCSPLSCLTRLYLCESARAVTPGIAKAFDRPRLVLFMAAACSVNNEDNKATFCRVAVKLETGPHGRCLFRSINSIKRDPVRKTASGQSNTEIVTVYYSCVDLQRKQNGKTGKKRPLRCRLYSF